jgi:sorbitol-specific phosphotransferase system component IIC
MEFGLSKVIGVSILLIGTGTIAGIIKASALQYDVTNILEAMNMPAFVLAPLAGILMAAATASTTAGATVAAQTFAPTLLSNGVSALGLPTVDLALRYFLIGIVINFLRGWVTDFTTAYVQKQQGVKLSKQVVAIKS